MLPHVRASAFRVLAVLAACQLGLPAFAQRAGQNAVTEAEDAFGTSTGDQAIGLYSLTDARGFNPQQAGNLRIEGLYFDQPTMYLSQCMMSAMTMRIGIAAQSYSFPAPTGIADIKLATPEGRSGVSAVVNGGSYQESGVLVEGREQLSDHVSAFGCAAYNQNFIPDAALTAKNVSFTTVWRWRPAEHTEIRPFWSRFQGSDHQVLPVVYTDGVLPPPLFAQRHLASQPFTSQGWRSTTYGAILRQSFDSPWTLSAGLFRAIEQDPQTFIDEYLSVLPNRTALHELDVVPAADSVSTSGEVRLARRFGAGVHQRNLELMVRGRRADRDFGGDGIFDYPAPVTLESPPSTVTAVYPTSPVSVDETRQVDVGAQFEERWKGVGAIGLGVLRSNYRRTLTLPPAQLLPGEPPPGPETAAPWLSSIRARVEATARLTIYGSFVQGLEDSALAPSTAVNRGEPPPATRSHQADTGVRYAPGERISLIVGLFDIRKSYFNNFLCPASGPIPRICAAYPVSVPGSPPVEVYTGLGTVRHHGLEASVSYADRGVTLVAGGVQLKEHVDRVLPEAGATGYVTTGPVPLVLNVNLDLAPPAWAPWAASLEWRRLSARVADNNDRYWLPPLNTLTAGIRFESKARNHPLSLRLEEINVTNAEGLHLSQVGVVLPEFGRRFALTFALDY
jgi:iron complex outermembrane receptor protein